MTSKVAPTKGIHFVINSVVIPRATFVGSRCSWSLAKCQELDSPINMLLRERSKNTVGYPTTLLYVSNKEQCELGIKNCPI